MAQQGVFHWLSASGRRVKIASLRGKLVNPWPPRSATLRLIAVVRGSRQKTRELYCTLCKRYSYACIRNAYGDKCYNDKNTLNIDSSGLKGILNGEL